MTAKIGPIAWRMLCPTAGRTSEENSGGSS